MAKVTVSFEIENENSCEGCPCLVAGGEGSYCKVYTESRIFSMRRPDVCKAKSTVDEKRFIFIQVPDDMDPDERKEVHFHLNAVGQQKEPKHIFVLCPIGYKAMDKDELNAMLSYMLEAATV